MKHIDNDSAMTIRLEYPTEWDATSITAVEVSVVSDGGVELLAADDATIYTATTLGANATAGLRTITLAAMSGALVSGDRVQLSNPREDVVVESYASGTLTATLRDTLIHDHASGTAVTGRWATYNLDTSDTDTWTAGLVAGVYWEPDVAGMRALDLVKVAGGQYAIRAFKTRFQVLFPNEFRLIEQRADEWIAEVRAMWGERMNSLGLDIDSVVDTQRLDLLALQYARMIAASTGGDAWDYERRTSREDYLDAESRLLKSGVWQDHDQDKARDTDPEEAGAVEQVQILSRWW